MTVCEVDAGIAHLGKGRGALCVHRSGAQPICDEQDDVLRLLLRNGGEQLQEQYRSINPSGLVPAFQDDYITLTQSMAILEYLEDAYPQVPIMPKDATERARVRELAQIIACDIHPVNNLRVLRYLVHSLKVSEDDKNRWYRHWVETGLETVERQLAGHPATGRYCHGDTPTLADIVLVPQIFNAQRMDCRLDHVPTVMRIFGECMALPAFSSTQPSACPDAS